MAKKREILPVINEVISALMELSVDAAKLELIDNDVASRRFKKSIISIRNNEFNKLYLLSQDIREEMSARPRIKKVLVSNLPAHFMEKGVSKQVAKSITNKNKKK